MDTPFIKLIKTPRNRYFYDVGKNEIVQISNSLFEALHSIENGEVPCERVFGNPSEELMSLIEEGYLSTKRPTSIRHQSTDKCQIYLERKVDSITLQVTQDCNFRCKYCIYSEEKNKKQRSHKHENMAWDTAKRAIDFYQEHSIDSKYKSISFYGGEPLLQFDLIRKVVEYSEGVFAGVPLLFNMTTNGSLLNEQIVDFLVEHSFHLLVSVDGIKTTHDKNRVFRNGNGTYDIVMSNLNAIEAKHPEFYKGISINSVVDMDTDIDSVIALESELCGIPKANFQSNFVEDTDHVVIPNEDYIMKSRYQGFLAYLTLLGEIKVSELSSFGRLNLNEITNSFRNIKSTPLMSDVIAPSGPCVPGKTRLFVTTDGLLFPCERVNEASYMCIGNIHNGFDYTRIVELLNIGKLTEDKCKNCWAIRLCEVCAKSCDDGRGISADAKKSSCESSRISAERKIRSFVLMSEILNDYKAVANKVRE